MGFQEILNIVDTEIENLCAAFRKTPTLFYTEDDIVCYFYSLLQPRLEKYQQKDASGKLHSLIHKEYPTPFRCDMSDGKFRKTTDDEKTENKGSYRRGHFDIVILNPVFVHEFDYHTIKAQNYKDFIAKMGEQYNRCKYPLVLYGIEFMYSRDIIKKSKGKDPEKAIKDYADKIIQDTDKLKEAQNNGFMKKCRMLSFIHMSNRPEDIRADIETIVKAREPEIDIILDDFAKRNNVKN